MTDKLKEIHQITQTLNNVKTSLDDVSRETSDFNKQFDGIARNIEEKTKERGKEVSKSYKNASKTLPLLSEEIMDI